MQKPSQQFVSKLEERLRLAYRAEYQKAAAPSPARRFFRFFIPAFSGALVIVLVLMNSGNILNPPPLQNNQQSNDASDQHFEAFNEGDQEAQLVQDFDNDELNQIDNGVKFVASSNF